VNGKLHAVKAPRQQLMHGVEWVTPGDDALVSDKIARLIASKKGILLDISLGGTPQPRSVTLSPSGDIAHSPLLLPFPLPSNCAHTSVITHTLEYLPPSIWFDWWDEMHRIMQPFGLVYVSGPYGGDESHGWISDPQHMTRVVEASFLWLDPRGPLYALHKDVGRKTPKPWHPLATARVPGTQGSISYNVTLQKVKE
jgi:hypothetical protein